MEFKNPTTFNRDQILSMYNDIFMGNKINTTKIHFLEFSQILEEYLWPNYSHITTSKEYIILIVAITNEKIRQKIAALKVFECESRFELFFHEFLKLFSEDIKFAELTQLIYFLNYAFNSLEIQYVRKYTQKMVSLITWKFIRENRREQEFRKIPKLRKLYNAFLKKDAADTLNKPHETIYQSFLRNLMDNFLHVVLRDIDSKIIKCISANDKNLCKELSVPIKYAEHFLELLIDLEAHLPNRRFFNIVLDDFHFITSCDLSHLNYASKGKHHFKISTIITNDSNKVFNELHSRCKLFGQLLDNLKFYHSFEIDDISGEPYTEDEMINYHYEKLSKLQKICFKNYKSIPILLKFALSNISAIGMRSSLYQMFNHLPINILQKISYDLNFISHEEYTESSDTHKTLIYLPKYVEMKDFLVELLVSHHELRPSQLQKINMMPLYPTEKIIWDNNLVPDDYYLGQDCLALPKLNLQFLTIHDYLLRNFKLFQLETTYEIRQDIQEAIYRLKPWKSEIDINETGEKEYENAKSSVVFGGWSRMALPINTFNVIDIGKPIIGGHTTINASHSFSAQIDEDKRNQKFGTDSPQPISDGEMLLAQASRPSRVRADITVCLSLKSDVRKEWEALRKHDVCFLIGLNPEKLDSNKYSGFHKKMMKPNNAVNNEIQKNFAEEFGIKYVRGCEIEGILDSNGKIIEEGPWNEKKIPEGSNRTYRVWLDCNQYALDVNMMGSEFSYDERYFHILLRRKPKENNFKAILETIRNIMNITQGKSTIQIEQQKMSGDPILPLWLHDTILGFGEPDSATYIKLLKKDVLKNPDLSVFDKDGFLDFRDTFISRSHLESCFPQYTIKYITNVLSPNAFYKIRFPELRSFLDGNKMDSEIQVFEYTVSGFGPSKNRFTMPRNHLPFTTTQVQAIKSGILPGLTLIVGPPGTGKTDLAVQIAKLIYYSRPNERILIITHSNQALNAIFSKLAFTGTLSLLDESHLLRLGHGETQLETEKDFSKYGRVNFVLRDRLTLLNEANLLRDSLFGLNSFSESLNGSSAFIGQNLEKNISSNVITSDPKVQGETTHSNDDFIDADLNEGGQTHITTAIKQNDEGHYLASDTNYYKAPGIKFTCETALYFYQYEVLPRWKRYTTLLEKYKAENMLKLKIELKIDSDATNMQAKHFHFLMNEKIVREFPFTAYISHMLKSMNQNPDVYNMVRENYPWVKSENLDMWDQIDGIEYYLNQNIAQNYYEAIKKIFDKIQEYHAFEILRSGVERANYLLIHTARIIAMTCTHAALRREDLLKAGFKYDTLIVEEAAQILEIETFLPLLLQNTNDNVNRLKRCIMIGDHNQLPPVIKNLAFKNYANMDQSLFTRLIRLEVPSYTLDAQGRAKPSLCALYAWKYPQLGNLPHTLKDAEFLTANPGFMYDCQLIDVQDFNNVGESEPSLHFFQNLAEAEYAVALFTYMRLLGYPENKISILTTYNGQKHLIRDIIQRRCGENSIIGKPFKVTTVDKYQGQQNDYIILSLVRTKNVGHLRDVRRLIVAMSRARLGLYILARVSLFTRCLELGPVFNQLKMNPLQLHIFPNEAYPPKRKLDEPICMTPLIVQNMSEMCNFVYQLYMETRKNFDPVKNMDNSNVSSVVETQEVLENISQRVTSNPNDANVVYEEEQIDISDSTNQHGVNDVTLYNHETVKIIDEGATHDDSQNEQNFYPSSIKAKLNHELSDSSSGDEEY